MADKLTTRQAQILRFIMAHMAKAGYPPTRMEICEKMGYRSPNAAEEHLRALERKGALKILRGVARGIRVLDSKPAGLPVVGRVAAGRPMLADSSIRDYHKIAPEMFSPAADYLLTVGDGGMADAGLRKGDLLAVHRTDGARSGDIVAARMDGKVAVRRLKRGRGVYKARLIAEAPGGASVDVDFRDKGFGIEGVGVGMIRLLH